jgi:uncharacterized protein YuzB (UPF0349 family)
MSMKWCKKNLERYSQSVYDLLKEEYPDLEMEIADCVDACGLCTDVPFALRNNAVVSARDARGLYVKLKKGMSFMTGPALPGTYESVIAKAANLSKDEASSADA